MKGETCQSHQNNITGVEKKSPLPAGEWEMLVKGGTFSSGGFSSAEEWFWQFKPFSKLKTLFCKYWTSNENGRGATTTAKNEVFIGL